MGADEYVAIHLQRWHHRADSDFVPMAGYAESYRQYETDLRVLLGTDSMRQAMRLSSRIPKLERPPHNDQIYPCSIRPVLERVEAVSTARQGSVDLPRAIHTQRLPLARV